MNVPLTLTKAKQRFEKIKTEEVSFVLSLSQLARKVGARHYPIKGALRESLCEMSFLAIFIAWEEFLESTFEQYLVLGRKRISSVRPKIQLDNLTTARDLILGERRQYVEWSDPDLVRARAKIFFRDGEPYESALGNALTHLNRIRIVRNCSVHHSKYAADKFHSMIRELYGYGKKTKPGRFLLEPPTPGAMPAVSSSAYGSMFELFAEVLSAACGQIVP